MISWGYHRNWNLQQEENQESRFSWTRSGTNFKKIKSGWVGTEGLQEFHLWFNKTELSYLNSGAVQFLFNKLSTRQAVSFAGNEGTLSPGNLKWVTGNWMENPRITIRTHLTRNKMKEDDSYNKNKTPRAETIPLVLFLSHWKPNKMHLVGNYCRKYSEHVSHMKECFHRRQLFLKYLLNTK